MTSLRDLPVDDLYFSDRGDCLVRERGSELIAPLPAGYGEAAAGFAETIRELAEQRQSDRLALRHEGTLFRVQRIDTIEGRWWACRRAWSRPRPLAELRFQRRLVDKILTTTKQGSGLVLLGGRTGEGKTTSAYGIVLDLLMARGGLAFCVEDPPEIPFHGKVGDKGYCFQVEIAGENWDRGIHVALRSRPTIIFIGELRSREAARQALRASVNGHIVVTTLHAGSVQSCLQTLLGMVDGPERAFMLGTLSDGLLLVLHQRLVGGDGKRRLGHQVLAVDTPAVRSKIRAAQFELLATEIELHTRQLGTPPARAVGDDF